MKRIAFWADMSGSARGILLTIAAIAIFGLQDVLGKSLVEKYSPFQVAMIRYWGFAIFAVWMVSRQAPLRVAFRSKLPWWQVARSLVLVFDIWSFSFALKYVPLAELQGISLIYPLVVTVLAALILGERVGPFRIGAILVGFCGALIIVRPGGIPLDVGVVFAVLAASFYATYIVFTRKVTPEDGTATSLLYIGVVGAVATSLVGYFHWQTVNLADALKFIVLILTFVGAHSLMVEALRQSPASLLQPFNYLTLPWAIFLSWAVFGHLIDPVSLMGAGIVTMAGLFVWIRERKKNVKRIIPRVQH